MKRRWSVGLVVEPALAPRSMQKAEAKYWEDRPFRGNTSPAWTFRGACTKARRWNRKRSSAAAPGTWEVFGPAGKGDD